MIRAEAVTKIFGPNPHSVLPLLEQGQSKDDIQRETSHIIGVCNASFSLEPGEIFVIMGLSGSGKSTLIRCVNRLFEPTSGKIFLNDPDHGEQEITALDQEALRKVRKYQMSMVFQHFALFPHRTVLSNVVYGLEIQGKHKAEREEEGHRVLKMVGLDSWANTYPSELSGGMQQRVGLARGLATQAKVLLMDEPFSALDPLIKVNMQQELVKIQDELARTILFITHDLDEAMRIGNHIAIMEAGEIVQIGTPEEILVNPRTEYVANFVEHADPTGVITAKTIALPLRDKYFDKTHERNGIQYLHRKGGERSIEYGIDDQGKLENVRWDDRNVTVQSLEDAYKAMAEESERRDDTLVTCRGTCVLRDVLRCRSYTSLPIIVTDDSGRVVGLIDEPELITAILEKRGIESGSNESVTTEREAHVAHGND